MNETQELLREYGRSGSETAFRELVARYIDLVYSTAVRRLGGDSHRAEDVVQAVFTDLSRKAGSLPKDVMLGGWLHRHCCFLAANVSRTELRRKLRESEAVKMQELDAGYDGTWDEVAPVVDEAIEGLQTADRDAIVLRYLEQRDLRTVGERLGVSEDAAQKRVSRALEKLRQILLERGVSLTLAGLGAVMASRLVTAAPVEWSGRISEKALAGGASKAGLAGTFAGLAGAIWLKFAGGLGVALALAAAAMLYTRNGDTSDSREQGSATTSNLSVSDSVAGADPVLSSAAGEIEATEVAQASSSDPLRLVIVAADSGMPIPNVPIDYRGWEGDKFTGRKLMSDRFGVCAIDLPRETLTWLELTTRVGGFADTRVEWRPPRGDAIPAEYKLALDRGVPIGGWVRDARGAPVAGAKVGFNSSANAVDSLKVESHDFSWIEVESGADGRWVIDRIAEEMIRGIYGSAKHPDYLNSKFATVSEQAGAEEKLRRLEFEFVLGDADVIRGFVTDKDGNPVPDAKILLGSLGDSSARKTTSALDGSFEIKGAKPGKNMVTAESDRFAPKTVNWDSAIEEPLIIQLEPGRILKMRVTDRQGNPIPKARFWLDTFYSGPIDGKEREPIVQADYRPVSDENGMVIWYQAPDHELDFHVRAKGYMSMSDIKVRADGTEHQIVLPPALVIRGTVRDADTGEPIPNFNVITGWPNKNPFTEKVIPQWSTLDRFWLRFSDGKFEHVYEEPVIVGRKDIEFMFKIEADGYEPYVTRVVRAEEKAVIFNIELRKDASAPWTVLLPDGTPAANAEILLASAMQYSQLEIGTFGRQSSGVVYRTDDSGKMRVNLGPEVARIYAVAAGGFASLAPEEMNDQSVIQLRGWGRVQGRLTSNGKPRADVEVVLSEGPWQQGPWLQMPRARTDKTGFFSFDQAPAGHLKVAYLAPAGPGHFTHADIAKIEVRPGETTEANHAEDGVEVVVRFVWPAGMKADEGLVSRAVIHPQFEMPRPEILQNPEALALWRERPEIKDLMSRNFQLRDEGNGVWRSRVVPPGKYQVNIAVSEPADGTNSGKMLVHGVREIIIPDNFEGEVFDAGAVRLTPGEVPVP